MSKSPIETKLQAIRVLELKSQGHSNPEIAQIMGIGLSTVSRAINSQHGKDLLEAARLRLQNMVVDAAKVYERALGNSDEDMTNSLKAAKDVLKNFGLMRDQVELNHNFPKPTVIQRVDGTEVVLGVAKQIEDNDET